MSEVQQGVPLDPLAGKNYRIRQLLIVLDLDLYDDDGFLVTRGQSDSKQPIVIAEAEFPAGLVEIIKAKTLMARGFVARPAAPAAPLHAVPDAG